MSKKMGRPKLPKGAAKGFQMGIRFDQSDKKLIDAATEGMAQSKSDWARDMIRLMAAPSSKCHYSVEELDEKTVVFKIKKKEGGRLYPIIGNGTLLALQR